MAKQKYYVVWKGKTPGVYHTWAECQKQVVGFEGAQFLSFNNLGDAEVAFTKNPWVYLNKGTASAKKGTVLPGKIIQESLSVDAATCSSVSVAEADHPARVT